MLGPVDAVLIGVRQGISIFSNISRSGTPVATGMFTCIEREQPEVFFAIRTCNSRDATIDAFLAQDTREAAEDLRLIRIESYAIGE